MVQNTFSASLRKLLTAPCSGVLIAVSGGVDSMVMTHLFIQWMAGGEGVGLCQRIAMAHMDFCLRGEESEGDQAFVADFARENGITFYTKKVNTRTYAAEKGISTEMAARELRYDWFGTLCREHGLSHIAVAHNANDRAETVLLNLVRGTGIRGLCSMRMQNGTIIRPLLHIPRAMIEEYAHHNGIAYRTDSTNLQTDFARNKIRHLVLPVLEEISPNVISRIGKNADNFLQVQQLLDALAEKKRAECATGRGFSIPALLSGGQVEYWLYALLSPYGFNPSQLEDIALAMEGQSGKRFLSASHTLWIDRGELVVRELDVQAASSQLEYRRLERAPGFVIPEGPAVAALDADTLLFPLRVRPWEEGDRFIPLGMKGYKKISDFLTDLKIPLYDKDRIQVLCSGNDIVWVIGLRIDNRFRITKKTTTILLVHETANGPGSPGVLPDQESGSE
ncbi:MAG: tRNA lysidine(34) synthetase TilS [Bacteroidales bacterium]|jgi:tRNA(Ile)-lysidine synthase|nr:tRNA lysidine(34) synthetase TilS [Bacteroidales bacterium]